MAYVSCSRATLKRPAQRALLAEANGEGVDLHADVLKVPHHGSANQAPELAGDRRTATRGDIRRLRATRTAIPAR